MNKFFKFFYLTFFLFILISYVPRYFEKDVKGIPAGFKGSYVTVSGLNIRVNQLGSGQDLLFIHGIPGSIEDWDPIAKNLSRDFRVTLYDQPGHGFSDMPDMGFNLEYNAKIAFELINKLHLNNVIVVGHSYGGSVIMQMAIKQSNKIKAFIPIAGAVYPLDAVNPLYRLIGLPIIGRGLAGIASLTLGPDMILEGIDNAFFPNKQAISDDFVKKRLKIWLQAKVIVTTAKEESNLNTNLVRIMSNYKMINKKFHIIHGYDDLLVPAKDSITLHEKIKNSKVTVIGNTGHQVQFVRPKAIISAIHHVSEQR